MPSYLEFPTDFPLKAIGTGDDFEALVLEVVRRHVPDRLADNCTTLHSSSGGKYLGVTITFVARSQAQLDAIYQELTDNPRVKMLL